MKNEEIISKLDPKIQPFVIRFLDLAKQEGFDLRITSGLRTIAEQNELYAQGRTKPGKIVTNARGSQSIHTRGLAFDVVDRKRGYEIDWERLGTLGESVGLSWGGRWTSFIDRPHFEKTQYDARPAQEDSIVITDQTKIPQLDNKEVQAIRSDIEAKDRKIGSLENAVKNLERDYKNMEAQARDAYKQFNECRQTSTFTKPFANLLFQLAQAVEGSK